MLALQGLNCIRHLRNINRVDSSVWYISSNVINYFNAAAKRNVC